MDDAKLTTTYHRFAQLHNCYLDGILCDPALREPFLNEFGGEPEAEVLGRLVQLRKRGQLARKKPK